MSGPYARSRGLTIAESAALAALLKEKAQAALARSRSAERRDLPMTAELHRGIAEGLDMARAALIEAARIPTHN